MTHATLLRKCETESSASTFLMGMLLEGKLLMLIKLGKPVPRMKYNFVMKYAFVNALNKD